MVVPYTDSRISRSMVRIPGTGIDGNTDATCLNLGNVSQFAAMIPVPQTLSYNPLNGRHQITSSFNLAGSTNQKLTGETTSSSAVDVTKADAAADSSVPLPGVDSSSIIQTEVAAVPRVDVPTGTSRPITTPSAGTNGQRTSGFKRPIREESTEDPEVHSVSKRRREAAAAPQNRTGSVGSLPTLSNQHATSSWALPSGAWGSNGTTLSSMPIFVPVVRSSGTPLVVPLAMVQSTNGAPPTFVFQPVPAQVTRYQPVLMAATKSLPTIPAGPQTGPKRDIRQVVQERDHLKKENEALKYRLSRFHQLFRSKEKLITVLRHLDAVPT